MGGIIVIVGGMKASEIEPKTIPNHGIYITAIKSEIIGLVRMKRES